MNTEDAKQFITNLREKEFHISKDNELIQRSGLKDKALKNSLKNLSEDLNSNTIHFIFELIQNAEDNNYNGVGPSLIFRLVENDPTHTKGSDGAIIVINNEAGFLEKNIKSICGGASTKKL